jgi:hypothetical protein
LLDAINNLLHQLGVVALEFGFFQGDIGCLTKFLVGTTELVFEGDPILLRFSKSLPFENIVFETTRLV